MEEEKEELFGLHFDKFVDKSVLFHGFTFGVSGSPYVKLFEGKQRIKPGEYRDIKIILDGKEYPAKVGATKVRFWRGKKYPIAYRILYGEGKSELKEKLTKIFISSFLKVRARKKLTKTTAREILRITPLSENKIKFEPLLREETEYDDLFKEFIEKDVFGWLDYPEEKRIFLKSSKWLPKKLLKTHEHEKFVIYYLVDTKNESKKLYVGSAKHLGSRLKSKRPEIPKWNKFRYDTLKPEFSGLLRRIEFHTILSLACIFKNKMNRPTLGIEEFILVNKARGLKP